MLICSQCKNALLRLFWAIDPYFLTDFQIVMVLYMTGGMPNGDKMITAGEYFITRCYAQKKKRFLKHGVREQIQKIKVKSMKDQELKQSEPKSSPQNQNGK